MRVVGEMPPCISLAMPLIGMCMFTTYNLLVAVSSECIAMYYIDCIARNIGSNYIWQKCTISCIIINIGQFNVGDIRIQKSSYEHL